MAAGIHSPREQAASWVAELREARQSRGYTQERLAASLSVLTATVRSWESGRRIPVLGTLLRVARELGLRLVIVGGDGRVRTTRTTVLPGELWEQREIRTLIAVLRAERRRSGISQDALAADIGIGAGSLVRFENGQLCPRPAVFVAWLDSLGCTAHWRTIFDNQSAW